VAVGHLEVPQMARLQGVVRLHPFLKSGPSEKISINCTICDLEYCTGGCMGRLLGVERLMQGV